MKTSERSHFNFYTCPASMTSSGKYEPMFNTLPNDVAGLTRIIQGLLLHEHASPLYGVTLTNERRSEAHLRSVEQMLDRLFSIDDRPLSVARSVNARLVGVCRHFTVLLVALLRVKGIPARARCGFGSYFKSGHFYDHWVCEYWKAVEARWILVDAQLDDVQRTGLTIDFDPLDVPRDRFVIAGDAWTRCRTGGGDPSKFGIFDMHGLWFVVGNVVRDVAALNNMEMLPWDVWGVMPQSNEQLGKDQFELFDRLAALTLTPDSSFDELRALYVDDERLQVPATVFNAVLNRLETL